MSVGLNQRLNFFSRNFPKRFLRFMDFMESKDPIKTLQVNSELIRMFLVGSLDLDGLNSDHDLTIQLSI